MRYNLFKSVKHLRPTLPDRRVAFRKGLVNSTSSNVRLLPNKCHSKEAKKNSPYKSMFWSEKKIMRYNLFKPIKHLRPALPDGSVAFRKGLVNSTPSNIRLLSNKCHSEETKKNSPYKSMFWSEKNIWERAAKNTRNCLIGCNIGDFGTIILLNYYYPTLEFHYVMPIAMASGLATSIMLETAILKHTEGLSLKKSFKVASSMSTISMVTMEFAENLTDYALTHGQASVNEPWFWVALSLSTISGFLTPLPYNYYQLAKYGKSCHSISEIEDNSDSNAPKPM